MLSKEGWIKLVEKFGFRYNPKLSSFFESVRIKEIANLYMLGRYEFN
jgi:hypothetical protein